jgi:hypothetical protein
LSGGVLLGEHRHVLISCDNTVTPFLATEHRRPVDPDTKG